MLIFRQDKFLILILLFLAMFPIFKLNFEAKSCESHKLISVQAEQEETPRERIEVQNVIVSEKEKFVFVLGMHHSMTSVATKLMIDTGLFHAGNKSELLMHEANPMKYWEYRKAVEVNQKSYDKLCPQNPRKTEPWLGYGYPNQIDKDLQEDASEIITKLYSEAKERNLIPIMKDPRTSLTIQSWLTSPAITKFNIKPICLILIRDGDEAVYKFLASYNYRYPLSAQEWISVWENYTLKSIQNCFKYNAEIHIFRHEAYTVDPLKATRDIVAKVSSKEIVNELRISTNWTALYAKKNQHWHHIKKHLPKIEQTVVSDSNSIEELALKLLEWRPLTSTNETTYLTIVQKNMSRSHALNHLQALRRSISIYDGSRPFYVIIDPEFGVSSLKGWKTFLSNDCQNVTACVQHGYELISPKSVATGQGEDGKIRITSCLDSCYRSKWFQALLEFGQSVSV